VTSRRQALFISNCMKTRAKSGREKDGGRHVEREREREGAVRVYLPDVDAATRMTATRTKAVVVVERTMLGSSRPRTVIAASRTRLHEAVTDTLRGWRHRHAPASPRPMTSRPAASAPPINRTERTIRRCRRGGKRRRGVSNEARVRVSLYRLDPVFFARQKSRANAPTTVKQSTM